MCCKRKHAFRPMLFLMFTLARERRLGALYRFYVMKLSQKSTTLRTRSVTSRRLLHLRKWNWGSTMAGGAQQHPESLGTSANSKPVPSNFHGSRAFLFTHFPAGVVVGLLHVPGRPPVRLWDLSTLLAHFCSSTLCSDDLLPCTSREQQGQRSVD